MTKGWKRDRYEHGLASKGIKTKNLNGLAKRKGITEKDVDPKELRLGIKVEMEHTKNPHVAKQIALDHLAEDDRYYTKHEEFEKTLPINKPTIVIDIDGTILDTTARWNEAKKQAKPPSPKFWNEFMNPKLVPLDKPIPETVKKLRQLESLGMKVIYLSGRRSNLIKETKALLEKHGYPTGRIILRKLGDETVDFKIMNLLQLKSENNIKVYVGDESRDLRIGKQTRIPSVRVMPNRRWDDNLWESIKKKATKNI